MEGDVKPSSNGGLRLIISIHALRVEGDHTAIGEDTSHTISIHALRVEGDLPAVYDQSLSYYISIHALRVEGDRDGIAFRPKL